MPASIPLQNAWSNHIFGGSAMTQPTQWWVQLHYGNPGGNCTDYVWEAAGRKQCTSWSAVVDGTVSNAAQIQWLNVPDPGSSVPISWASVWTASSGGTPLPYCRLDVPITPGPGDDLTLAPGALVITNELPSDLGDVTGAVVVSFVQARTVTMRLTGNVDLSGGILAPAVADWRMLIVEQDGTGGRTITWPTLLGSEPVVSPAANSVTVICLVWDGSNWHVLD